MLDINQPTTAVIEITSAVADFQLSGQLGWQAKVNLTHLPQYPLDEATYLTRLEELLLDIGIVPYDNLAIAESAAERVREAHAMAIQGLKDQGLSGDVNPHYTFTYSVGVDQIYRLSIVVTPRIDGPNVMELIEQL